MEKIDFIDDNGAVLTMKKYEGNYLSPLVWDDFEGQISALDGLGFTKDDVLIVTYLKSGTHWTYEITNMILNRSTEYFKYLVPILDYTPLPALKQQFAMKGIPRSIVTHFQRQYIPKSVFEQNVRIIFVYRNPKDVAVSMFNFLTKVNAHKSYANAEWNNFFKHFLDGNVPGDDWVSFHKDWLEFRDGNPDYPFLLLSYEGMKENTEDAVGRIAKFLKEDIDSEMISQIANKSEFQKMLTEKNSNLPPHFEMVTSLKEHVFYRKGEVGDWKNWFTVSQNEEFDTRLGHLADDLKLNIRYTL